MSNGHHQQQTATTVSDNNNHTYRPRSPDLSAYILPPNYNQQQQQQQQHFHPIYQDHASVPSWHPRQGSSAALIGLPSGPSASGAGYPLATHRGSYDASPYFSPQRSLSQSAAEAGQGSFGGQQGQSQALPRRETLAYASAAPAGSGAGEYSARLTYSPTTTTSTERYSTGKGLLQQSPSQGQVQGDGLGRGQIQPGFSQVPPQAQTQAPGFHSLSSSISQQQRHPQSQHDMPRSRRRRGPADGSDGSGDLDYRPGSETVAAGEAGTAGAGVGARSSRKRKSDGDPAWITGRAPGEVGPSLGIDIKTKFPVARIKRIMQADEDVGKVAQATPTAVCKLAHRV
jgi:Histone-like transcription factor (CBF/NF-Y) and archaeal histone